MVTGTDGDGQPASSDFRGWNAQWTQVHDTLNSTAWSNWKIASIPWISTASLLPPFLYYLKIIKAWASDSLRAKRIPYWGYSVKRSGTPKRGWNPFLGIFSHRRLCSLPSIYFSPYKWFLISCLITDWYYLLVVRSCRNILFWVVGFDLLLQNETWGLTEI